MIFIFWYALPLCSCCKSKVYLLQKNQEICVDITNPRGPPRAWPHRIESKKPGRLACCLQQCFADYVPCSAPHFLQLQPPNFHCADISYQRLSLIHCVTQVSCLFARWVQPTEGLAAPHAFPASQRHSYFPEEIQLPYLRFLQKQILKQKFECQ